MCMFGKISVIWEIQFPWFLFAGISFFFSSSRMSGHNISLHTSQVTQGPWPGSCGLEQFTDLMVCPFISDFFLSLKMSLSWLLLRIKECWNKSPKCQEKNKMYLSLNKKSVKKKSQCEFGTLLIIYKTCLWDPAWGCGRKKMTRFPKAFFKG